MLNTADVVYVCCLNDHKLWTKPKTPFTTTLHFLLAQEILKSWIIQAIFRTTMMEWQGSYFSSVARIMSEITNSLPYLSVCHCHELPIGLYCIRHPFHRHWTLEMNTMRGQREPLGVSSAISVGTYSIEWPRVQGRKTDGWWAWGG